MFAYDWFKFLAFRFDPESAHILSLKLLSQFPASLANIFDQKELYPRYQTTLKCGLTWPFPVGLAAGLDKNAAAIDFFSSLLFGAIEVGTVTPRPQEGNPRPRIFRLQKEQSLLNRLGFNNLGMEKNPGEYREIPQKQQNSRGQSGQKQRYPVGKGSGRLPRPLPDFRVCGRLLGN